MFKKVGLIFLCLSAMSCGNRVDNGDKPVNNTPEPPPVDNKEPQRLPLGIISDKTGKTVFDITTIDSQGVVGTIHETTGNCMPSVGNASRSCESHALVTKVYVFKGWVSAPKMSQEEALNRPNYLGTTETDEDGRYAIGLPPGVYTILAEFDGLIFINSFGGGPVAKDPSNPKRTLAAYSAIEIKINTIETLDINNTDKASF